LRDKIRGASDNARARNVRVPFSGDGLAKKGDRFDKRVAGIGPAAVRRACACHSERRLCEAVHLNLAYRWFCRLGLEGKVADHATFFEEPPWSLRESDASGDTPRGSLRNPALAQLIGTNHGPSGFAYRELSGPAQENGRPAFAFIDV
jgi:Transposase domain (DUF772)